MTDAIDDREIDILSAGVGLTIAPEHRAGVSANLRLLRAYSELIDEFPLPDREEPAFEYHP
ncbi:hypothetical protein AA101099_0852 [Neoasaia chiangmaiensis NBRC 101099]|uniref:Uncharacterized protein n=1 Tax=Neoasaia chiangmaiensis TaxID=320497 RepID=A0A1U9KME6_9PROT|nr:DUF4089 domain-containing protein [Neoasaia chiangmaiensis]AQS86971.1 hypothetical protein A0U93_02330 [Neoasaia chiangmaiensis]GBR37725.1 hypothetical protein AA101099_0852 [Neoasaia chiangmaiensis NBRC 101099]GEN15089.1 hypothetical protein NCH01_15200 [Neoasaia chiangmaiensis]